MAAEHLQPEYDPAALSSVLPNRLVRDVLSAQAQQQADLLLERYGDVAGVPEAISAVLTRYARGHLFAAKAGLRLEEQGRLVSGFFALETIHDLVPLVGELAERRRMLLTSVRAASASGAIWSALDTDYIEAGLVPSLPTKEEYWDAGFYLGPEAAHLHSSHQSSAAGDGPGSYFKMWRNPVFFGLEVPLHGRGQAALKRFSGPIVDQVQSSSTVLALEDAYFAHMRREIDRAYYPFGLVDATRRDTMTLAVALAFEAESAGTFDAAFTPLGVVEPGNVAFASTLRSAYHTAIRWLTRPAVLKTTSVRVQGFDLVRAAAAVQRHYTISGSLADPVAPSGWSRVLQKEAFDVSSSSEPPHEEIPAAKSSARRPYSRELLRLLPYSQDLADELTAMWPAGSVRKITQIAQNADLPFTQGSARGDGIVFDVRREILDGFYREQVMNEQLGLTAPEPTLAGIQSALIRLLKFRIKSVYIRANEVPFEEPHSPEEDGEDSEHAKPRHEQGTSVRLDHDGLAADAVKSGLALSQHDIQDNGASRGLGASAIAASRQRSTAEVKSSRHLPWIDEFFEVFLEHLRLWTAYRRLPSGGGGTALTGVELEQLTELDAFTVWLRHEVHRREGDVVRAAREIRTKMRSEGRDRGSELPVELRDRDLSDFAGDAAEALKMWVSTRPDLPTRSNRDKVRKAVASVFNAVYSSPLWRSLAQDDWLTPSDRSESHTTSRQALADVKLRDLVPRFISQFETDADADAELPVSD